jgi:16S rRNA (guanine527-N7)-methyltransferase
MLQFTLTEMEAFRIQQLLAPYVPHPLREAQLTVVARYLDLLIRWNQRLNLTAIREPEEIVTRHFGESFFAASKLFPPGGAAGARLVDVGSGAGFPGLAMRVYAPLQVTLIESRQRKAAFLREAARVLGFRDVEVFSDRAERYIPPPSVSSMGMTVTLRAVEKFAEALPAAASILHSWSQKHAEAVHAGEAEGQPGRGHMALLIGAEQAARANELAPAISWGAPVPIPQSRSRILLVGEELISKGKS